MSPADLAGTRPTCAPADEGRGSGRVVGRAERARRDEVVRRFAVAHRTHTGCLERFVRIERREDRLESAGQHRLAAARWAGEEQVVPARGCDLEGESGSDESAHLGEIHGLGVLLGRTRWRRIGIRPGLLALQARSEHRQIRCGSDGEPGDERGLVCVRRRHDDRLDPGAEQRIGQHQRARHRSDRAVESELTQDADTGDAIFGQLGLTHEQPERNRELQPSSGLTHRRG